MFRCLSLLGIVAVAFGVAALASAAPQPVPKQLPDTSEPPRKRAPRPATFVRVPGLAFHASLSAN
jgi:hypothetical protein